MHKLGTNYGGWLIPEDLKLDENSIIYSVGVGEDISFDLLLQDKYGCNILLIDPTLRSKIHFEEIKKYYETEEWKFSGDIQKDYKGHISGLNVDFNKIKYIDQGLWDIETELKFYKQNNKQYVSQSLIDNMFGREYDLVSVTKLSEIMKKFDHTEIDLLKMDIEGAEVKVLNNMLDQEIHPKYLCIEFDLYLKGKDKSGETTKIINKLGENGYKVLANDNMNITMEYIKH